MNQATPAKRSFKAMVYVFIGTVCIIAIGKLLVPIVIAAAFPRTPGPVAPQRPTGSIHDLSDPSAKIRRTAVATMAKLNSGNAFVFEKLAERLREDSAPDVRLEAAKAFADSQPLQQFSHILAEALSDESSEVRGQVLIAIGRFGMNAEFAKEGLQQIANNESETEANRQLAIEIIGDLPAVTTTPEDNN